MNKTLTFHITYDLDAFKRDFAEMVDGVDLDALWTALVENVSHKGNIFIDVPSGEDQVDVIEQAIDSLALSTPTDDTLRS